jgi:hypothetical protein
MFLCLLADPWPSYGAPPSVLATLHMRFGLYQTSPSSLFRAAISYLQYSSPLCSEQLQFSSFPSFINANPTLFFPQQNCLLARF